MQRTVSENISELGAKREFTSDSSQTVTRTYCDGEKLRLEGDYGLSQRATLR